MENKEFKVITSNVPTFANREKMRKVLEEEAQAGWDLVEKLDNHKIRVGRDISARANDDKCAINPYRTDVGVNNLFYLGGAAIVTIVVVYLIIKFAAMSV